MAAEEENSNDFYGVLGLKKECTTAELRNAYKKQAMKWHPDRCSSSGNKEEDAKKKFQAIQQAYSVLSDANKRFLYDVGFYDCDDDDDENGMGDFLNEMAILMTQNKSNENRNENFKEFQELFEEIFRCDDTRDLGSSSYSVTPPSCLSSQDSGSSSCSVTPPTCLSSQDSGSSSHSITPPSCLSSQDSRNETYSISNKRNSSSMSSANFGIGAIGFRIGAGGTSRKRQRRKNPKKSKR